MANQNPEQAARDLIDAQLGACGWVVQGFKQFNAVISLSIEPEDLELSPFNQRCGLGKAHQLFGDQLPQLLEELNEVLAA